MSQHDYDTRTWEAVEQLSRDVQALRDTVTGFIAAQREICIVRGASIAVLQTETFGNGNGKRGLRGDMAWIIEREKARIDRTKLLVVVMLANIVTIIGGAVWIIRQLAGV